MTITLSGFMGCGKSSIGLELARMRGCPFLDLDHLIEESEGMSVADIFATKGEKEFRKIESRVLSEVLSGKMYGDLVLALGGGTTVDKNNAALVRKESFNVYLRATEDTLVENLTGNTDGRPLLKDARDLRSRVASMMEERAVIYAETARLVADVDGLSFTDAARAVNERLNQLIQ